MKDPRDMMAAYAEGQLSADEVAELETYLRANPEHAKAWVREAMLGCHLDELLREQNLEHMADDRSLDEPQLPPIHLASSDRLTKQQYLGALSYVLRHTFTPKRLITAGIAAALLLGAALAINLMTGPDTPDLANTPPNMPTASAEPTPRGSDPQPTPIVATLTAEHNAVWASPQAEGALAPGSQLRAGQRLTLTQGFAEITTARGAIAILQAPATIELTDNDNALRLHTGKLVGICETASSKGFVVRTPHMDITDLGTRFGVDVSDGQATQVCVFEGDVQVVRSGDLAGEQPPQRLAAGQAVTGSTTSLADAKLDIKPYVAALNLAGGMDDLRPHVEGDPMLWQGITRDDMTTGQQESELLQVYLERKGVVLEADVPVDMLPGEAWPSDKGFGNQIIPAGAAVDVYLLHFDALGNKLNREVTVKCVIHFDRPILGLIGAQSTLRATDQALGHPGTAYPDDPAKQHEVRTGGGIGLDDAPFQDTAILSADGRTLTLELSGARVTDQARVVVRSAGIPQHNPNQN